MKGNSFRNTTVVISNIDNKIKLGAITLALYIFLLPFNILSSSLSQGSLLRYVALLPIGFSLLEFMRGRFGGFNKIHMISILYIMFITFSFYWSNDQTLSVNYISRIVMLFSLFIIISMRKFNEKEMLLLKGAFLVVGIGTAIFIQLTNNSFEGRMTTMVLNSVEDQNALCGYFFFPIIFSLDQIFKIKMTKFKKVFYIIVIMYMLYTIILTGSRGGLIAITFGMVSYLLFKSSIKSIKKIVILAILGLIIYLLITQIPDLIPSAIVERFTMESIINDRGMSRWKIWGSLLQVFWETPEKWITGFGIGTITTLTGSDLNNIVGHNLFIDILLEVGMIGLFIYTSLLYFLLRKVFNDDLVLFFSLIAFIVSSLSLSTETDKAMWNVMILCNLTVIYSGKKCIKDTPYSDG